MKRIIAALLFIFVLSSSALAEPWKECKFPSRPYCSINVPISYTVIHDEITDGDPELKGFVATAEQVRNSLIAKGNFASIIYPDRLTSIFIADYTSPYFFDFKLWTEDELNNFIQSTKTEYYSVFKNAGQNIDDIECFVYKTNNHTFIITAMETHDYARYYMTINAQTMLDGKQVVFTYDCSASPDIERDIHAFFEIIETFKAE